MFASAAGQGVDDPPDLGDPAACEADDEDLVVGDASARAAPPSLPALPGGPGHHGPARDRGPACVARASPLRSVSGPRRGASTPPWSPTTTALSDPRARLARLAWRCAGPRSPGAPAIGPCLHPLAGEMVGNGGIAIRVTACCLARRKQDVTDKRSKSCGGWPRGWPRDHRPRQDIFCRHRRRRQ